MKGKDKVIIIAGPTASGKTDISIRLARVFDGEIISADSMQIYKHMDVGTAKIKREEMNGIKHHMIDIIEPDQNYSVAEFQNKCRSIIKDITSSNKLPFIVGGTGLYIHSIIKDVDFTQTSKDDSFRRCMNDIPTDALYNILSDKDPVSAERINRNDKKRIIRRLEIINSGDQSNEYDFWKDNNNYDYISIFLNPDREKLYKRIDERVDKMFSSGLIDEVRGLKDTYCEDCTSLQAIGYKEVISYLNDNELADINELKDQIKKNTRHYAKRQVTWFKKYNDFKWFDTDSYENPEMLFMEIKEYIDRRLEL